MSAYRRFEGPFRVAFLGTSDSAGRALDVVPGMLVRGRRVARGLDGVPDRERHPAWAGGVRGDRRNARMSAGV
jgi:hypothetical protein